MKSFPQVPEAGLAGATGSEAQLWADTSERSCERPRLPGSRWSAYSTWSVKIRAEVLVLLIMHLLSMYAARVLSPAIITPAW